MTPSCKVIARIIAQGPQAPLAGDQLTLPVYDYEVVTILAGTAPLRAKDAIQVAHLYADVDDSGFAAGRLRELELQRDLPASASLLYRSDQRRAGPPWYCPASTAVDTTD